jgi:hypothetical protein
MFDDDATEWETKRIHNSRPPLRWIANLAGSIASSGLLDVSYMQDRGYDGWRYKFHLWKWNTFWPIYNKYGTFYEIKTEEDYE